MFGNKNLERILSAALLLPPVTSVSTQQLAFEQFMAPQATITYQANQSEQAPEQKPAEKKEEQKKPTPIFEGNQPIKWDFRGTYDSSNQGSLMILGGDEHGKTLFGRITKDDESLFAGGGIKLFVLNNKLEFKGVGAYTSSKEDSSRELGVYATFRNYIGKGRLLRLQLGHENESSTADGISSVTYVNYANANFPLTSRLDLNGILSRVSIDGKIFIGKGAGFTAYLPANFFASANMTSSSDPNKRQSKTLAFGRFAGYANEKHPTGFLIYRDDKTSEFYLGGFFVGGKQQLVKPAATGILRGVFEGESLLEEFKDLRGFSDVSSTGVISDIAALSFFYVSFDQQIFGPFKVDVKDVLLTYSPNFLKKRALHIDYDVAKLVSPNFQFGRNDSYWTNEIGAGLTLNGGFQLGIYFKNDGALGKSARLSMRRIF